MNKKRKPRWNGEHELVVLSAVPVVAECSCGGSQYLANAGRDCSLERATLLAGKWHGEHRRIMRREERRAA